MTVTVIYYVLCVLCDKLLDRRLVLILVHTTCLITITLELFMLKICSIVSLKIFIQHPQQEKRQSGQLYFDRPRFLEKK